MSRTGLVTRSGGASATLRYDPLGRLYEVTGASGTRRFLYDGSDLVAEYNTSGTMLRRYVHGPGAGDDPMVWFEGAGIAHSARRYLYADERGSIVAVTNSTGGVLAVNKYDEYGIPAAGNLGTFQYTGQVWLPELGMYHYKARMYSPTLGRFMQTDPIGYGDGMNMYAYVGNDPVNAVDPTGMFDCVLASATDTNWGPGGKTSGVMCFGGPGGGGGGLGGGGGSGGQPVTPGAICGNPERFGFTYEQIAHQCSTLGVPQSVPAACSAPSVTLGFGGAVTGTAGSPLIGQEKTGFDVGVAIQIHIPTAFEWRHPFAGWQASVTLADSDLVASGAYVGAGANLVGGYGPSPTSGFSETGSTGFGGGLGRGASASSVFSYSGGEGANTTGVSGAVGVRPGLGVGAYSGVYQTRNLTLATAKSGC